MSNDIATKILALNPRNIVERSQIDTLLRENPEVGKLPVTYSYTREYGSDGCWDSTETSMTTLGAWVSGRYLDKHPGNRSYGFQITKVG